MKKITGLFLMAIGIVCSLFFYRYSGGYIPYPLLWMLISLVIILIGIRILLKANNESDRAIKMDNANVLHKIRTEWICVPVDYTKCVVKNYSFSYEQEVEHGRVAGMNVLSGDEMSNVQNVQKSQMLLEYPVTRENTGEEIVFQIEMYMDKESFDMRFIANNINLYVDHGYRQCLLDFGDRQIAGSSKFESSPAM